jgi:carboxylesterase type B
MDSQLAHVMSSYYANFAKTGDPNGPGLPVWPVFRPAAPQHMVFDEHGAAASPLALTKFRTIETNPPAAEWCPLTQ